MPEIVANGLIDVLTKSKHHPLEVIVLNFDSIENSEKIVSSQEKQGYCLHPDSGSGSGEGR
jgi:hypothetical protein